MQTTPSLELNLYEAADNANLLDGYNNSMRKIDARNAEVGVLISALSTTVTGYDTRITTAEGKADTASTKADTASAQATAAQAAAASGVSALASLGGISMEFIKESDKGSKWAAGGAAYLDQALTRFDAIIFTDDATGEGILVGNVGTKWTNTELVAAGSNWDLVILSNWKFVNASDEEVYEAYGYLDWVQNARMLVQPKRADPSTLILSNIKQIAANSTGVINSTIIAQVRRK